MKTQDTNNTNNTNVDTIDVKTLLKIAENRSRILTDIARTLISQGKYQIEIATLLRADIEALLRKEASQDKQSK